MRDDPIHIKVVPGSELAPYLNDLAQLRMSVFREWPYLYDGTPEYEAEYLATYAKADSSIALLAIAKDGQIIGASTGLALVHETEAVQAPFRAAGIELAKVFYCGESVLMPEYRGRGVYRQFFTGREEHARASGGFTYSAFCCVERPAGHALRPTNYEALDATWRHFGYERRDDLRTEFHWKDINESDESAKTMVFWLKTL